MVALTAMLVSGLQPCAAAQDNDTRRGAVLLTNGTALGGEIVGENERFVVFRHGDRILRIAREKVTGFEPQSELDRKIDQLAAHASSQTPFGRAQVGLQALSIGNFDLENGYRIMVFENWREGTRKGDPTMLYNLIDKSRPDQSYSFATDKWPLATRNGLLYVIGGSDTDASDATNPKIAVYRMTD